MATDNETIASVIATEGAKRVYQMADGSIETRTEGSLSWRDNNPGNLKYEYANSADPTVHNKRTEQAALAKAQSDHQGVVGLDQWGSAIFATPAAGRAAQATLLQGRHGDKTIEQMLPAYAKADYSGAPHLKAYAESIYKTGDAQSVDLRTKKIGELNSTEMSALQDGMKRVEGYVVGTTHKSPPSFRQLDEKSLQKMEAEGLAPPGPPSFRQTDEQSIRKMNEQGLSPDARLSHRQLEDKSLQKMHEEGVAPPGVASITDSNYPGNALYTRALAGMQAIDAKYGRASNHQTEQAAGLVAANAYKAGMTRIDHMELGGPSGDKIIAVQGQAGTAHSKVINVSTVQALNTPIEQSTQAVNAAQASQQQAVRQQQPDMSQQQSAPVMSR